jgi:3-deoxy-D-manno-octulosonate 8-phosphate phosphatase (KDO 8-P phosphatase)
MIKLIILDVDGVLTDGKKYYDRDGTVRLKTFCDKDWTAIKRFRAQGINVIFLTGDPFNVSIAENRKIDVIVNRQNGTHTDKADYLNEICQEYGVNSDEILFVGDDIFDYGLMSLIGYKFCPFDAVNELKNICIVLKNNGGNNLISELYEYLTTKDMIPPYDLKEHLNRVYELDKKEKF